jgi:HEAT repeats
MKRTLSILVTALVLQSAPALAANAALASRVTEADGWVAWGVPMVTDAGVPCCYVDGRPGDTRAECDLDGRSHGFSTRDEARAPAGSALTVYAHVAHGRIDDVRAYDASCPVRSESAIRRIGAVAPGESIALLSSWIDGAGSSDDSLALAAIAYHADAGATQVLAARAMPARARKQREEALFWLGQARGADGAAIVEHYATTDADPKLREHAIFALSQSHADDPYQRIHAIASSDPSEHVRGQALFWMAQMDDARAAHDITAAISAESSSKAREEAVFALSQLEGGKGDDALIGLLRGDYPRDVKKQALFWLGQSGSPRALEFFDAALTR